MEITVQLPDTVEITAGKATEAFEWQSIPEDRRAEFVAQAAVTGVAKAGNDSASGAAKYAAENKLDVEVARATLIQKWIAARYESGRMGRVAGVKSDPIRDEAIRMYRKAVKAADPKWYKNATEEEKWERMEQALDNASEKEQASVLATAKARVEAMAKLAEELAALELPVKVQ